MTTTYCLLRPKPKSMNSHRNLTDNITGNWRTVVTFNQTLVGRVVTYVRKRIVITRIRVFLTATQCFKQIHSEHNSRRRS